MSGRFEDARIGDIYQDEVTVLNTYFFEEEKGFGIYQVRNEQEETFAMSGNWMEEIPSGSRCLIEGTVVNSKHGPQLKWSKLEPKPPKGKRGIMLYLSSLPGISTKRAETLYQRFGTQTLTLLKEEPERLAKAIKGIGLKTIKSASEALIMQEADQALYVQLYEWGLSQAAIRKLKDRYPVDLIRVLEENPYVLMRDVQGFGFVKCDELASRMGIHPLHPHRLEEALVYTLEKGESAGHCYLTKNQLTQEAKKLLQRYQAGVLIPDERLDAALEKLKQEERLVVEDDCWYRKTLYFKESYVALKLLMQSQQAHHIPRAKVEQALTHYLSDSGLELEAKQHEAAVTFNLSSEGVYILDGSAGTGKSFTLQVILRVMEALKKGTLSVLLMAPTGKASKVITQSTGMEASTVHRGLQYSPAEHAFVYNEDNPLDIDVVVIDESSMLDLELMYSLCAALKPSTKLILMGDTKQLPSVGPGNVLKDLIESAVFPVVTLDVIRRQGLLSDILKVANDIIKGGPIGRYSQTNDAFTIYQSQPHKIQDLILRSIARLLDRPDYDLDEIQVLSCQSTGSLGTHALNYLIQERFNPTIAAHQVLAHTFTLVRPNGVKEDVKLCFKPGDKVIHIHNQMDMPHHDKLAPQHYEVTKERVGLINGDCGQIDDIYEVYEQGKKVTVMAVRYEQTYVLYRGDFSALKHAYCLTIHKSQGSAWKALIVPIASQHDYMLENNLLYTAWTRTRTFGCLIGDEQAINKAIQTFKANKRQTRLAQRVKAAKALADSAA